MANIKITELNAAGSLAADDVLPVVDISTDETKKITSTNLFRTLPDGTAAAPALAFSSDQANGIYLAGTDTVGITTGGTQRVTVDASGNVVISGDLTVQGATTTVESTTVTIDDKNIELGSVASPSNTTADGGGITLKGASDKTIKWINSTGCWTFNQPTNFNDHVRIDSSGNVGVGTTSPRAKVDFGPGSGDGTLSQTLSQYQAVFEAPQGTGDISRNIAFAVTTGGICAAINATDEGGSNATGLMIATGTAGSISERLRIDSNGQIDINSNCRIEEDGLLKASNGSAAAPSHAFLNDPDNGMFRATTNTLGFSTGGSERMRIDSSGRLGLGTSSPDVLLELKAAEPYIQFTDTAASSGYSRIMGTANNALVIGADEANNVSGSYVAFNVDATERMRIDSSGNVGIGTSSPSGRLTIKDGGYRQGIVLERAGSTVDRGFIYIGDGTNSTVADEIYLDANNTAFHFRQGGSGTTETVTFASSGKVGVGTTSPANNLDIAVDSNNEGIRISSSTNVFGKIDFHANRSGADAALGILDFNWNGTQVARIIGGTGTDTTNKDDGTLQFHTAAAGSASEAMRIDSSGRLLVGTSTARSNFDNTTNAARFQIEGADNTKSTLAIIQDFNANTLGARLILAKNNSTTVGSNVLVDSGDTLGAVSFQGNDGSQFVQAATVSAQVDGTPGANDMPGRLVFSTSSDGASSPTERMRIDSSGRLLVGLSSSVDGSNTQINFSATLNRGSNATAADANIGVLKFADLRSNSAYGEIRCQSDGTPGTNDYPGRIVLATTADGASSPTERLRITSTGAFAIEGASNYGSSGQVLTSNGNDAPTWQTVGAASVGGATAISMNDNVKINFGASNDLQIYHDGSHSYVSDVGTGDLRLASNGTTAITKGNSEMCAGFNVDGAVELYYDNSQKFATTNGGINITGSISCSGGSSNNLSLPDNGLVKLGTGDDLQIYHDGSHSYINQSGTGNLFITHGSETMIYAEGDGQVQLRFNNSPKLATKSDGIDVTGEVQCDSLDVDGNGDFTGDVTFRGGAAAVNIAAGSDIRFANGSWTGEHACKVQHHAGYFYFQGGTAGFQFRSSGGIDRCRIDSNGNFIPASNNAYDLGSNSLRWRNVYTNDLNLSNEGSTNDVDGTWGNYTIQEGEDDLFLINRRSGKKYKFNLTEVS